MVYGKALSHKEFNEIIQYIHQHHKFGVSGKHIKYARPSYDFRDSTIFHVEFDGIGQTHTFDFRDNEKSMRENILTWLA